MSLRLHLPDLTATHRAGEALGGALAAGDVIGLDGPLGAGKTSLVQGLARGLQVPADEPVQSPTFTLLQQHQGRLTLHHADLYRIERERELDELGLWELAESGGVLAVEWLSRFPRALDADRLQVDLAPLPPPAEGRELRLGATGPRAAQRLHDLRQALLAAGLPVQEVT